MIIILENLVVIKLIKKELDNIGISRNFSNSNNNYQIEKEKKQMNLLKMKVVKILKIVKILKNAL